MVGVIGDHKGFFNDRVAVFGAFKGNGDNFGLLCCLVVAQIGKGYDDEI